MNDALPSGWLEPLSMLESEHGAAVWRTPQVRCMDPAFGDWLQRLQAVLGQYGRAVTVTVAQVVGSAPREPGARMLVWVDGFAGTVGGGHLELDAIQRAQAWLQARSCASAAMLRSYSLGASLGQCCGGRVELLFEGHSREDAWLRDAGKKIQASQPFVTELQLRPSDLGLVTNAQNSVDTAIMRPKVQGHEVDVWLPSQRNSVVLDTGISATQPFMYGRSGNSGAVVFRDVFGPVGPQVWVYGAGHVGQAVVRLLGNLPCQVMWVDDRFDHPEGSDGSVACAKPVSRWLQVLSAPKGVLVWSDDPIAAVAAAPDQAMHLVMTHSHALDEALCAAVLQREHVWLGLIGSATKRRRFEMRLTQRGVAPDRLAAMVCPLGIEGIQGKAPQVLALSIAAQLQQIFEEQQMRRGIQ